MNKSKEKRIKRLKKKRIWPSILGLFIILCIFSVIMVVALAVSGMDIVQRKLMESSRKSVEVAEIFANYNTESEEEIEQTVLSYVEMFDEIKAVSVIDMTGKPLWSSNEEYPATDNAINIDFMPGIAGEDISVIIADDSEQVFTVDEEGIVVNKDALENILSESEFKAGTLLTEMKVWLVIPVGDLEVLVLNNVSLYFQDFLMMGTCIVLCGLLIGIFVIYYLISIISMVSSVRKTTKIIYTDMVTGGDNWLLFIRKSTKFLKKNRKGHRNYAMVHLA